MASDHNAMAALAARLMGGGRTSMASSTSRAAPPSPSTPRSLPNAQISRNVENTPPPARGAAAAAQVKITSPVPQARPASTTTNAPTSPPALTERDTNFQNNSSNMNANTNAGPSLKGDPAALKEAREFLQSASHGKIRPSRSRMGSNDRTSFSTSSSTMSRTSAARDMLASNSRMHSSASNAAPVTSPRSIPRAEPAGSAIGGWQGFGSLHNRPAITSPAALAPAQQQTAAPPALPFTFNLPAATGPIASSFNGLTTPAVTAPKTPGTPEPADKGAGLRGRQVADINNTLTGRTKDVPPHLRAKVAATSTKPAAPAQIQHTPIPMPMQTIPAATASATATKPTPEAEIKNPFAVHLAAATTPFEVKPVTETQPRSLLETPLPGTKSDPIVLNGDDVDEKPATPVTTPAQTPAVAQMSTPAFTSTETDETMSILAALKREVEGLTVKVGTLEEDNMYLNKKVEELVHANERRKFLGTDNAKAPYTVTVIYPNGTSREMQASMGLRVSDLIRSARLAANKGPAETQGPRLIVRGEQVGHSMTLGELGIVKGEKVEFTYDGAEDEAL